MRKRFPIKTQLSKLLRKQVTNSLLNFVRKGHQVSRTCEHITLNINVPSHALRVTMLSIANRIHEDLLHDLNTAK